MNFHSEVTFEELLNLSKVIAKSDGVIYVYDPYMISKNLNIYLGNNVIINHDKLPLPDFNIVKPFIQCILITESIRDIANFIFNPQAMRYKINRLIEQTCSQCNKKSNSLKSFQNTLGRSSDEGYLAYFICHSCSR